MLPIYNFYFAGYKSIINCTCQIETIDNDSFDCENLNNKAILHSYIYKSLN